MNRIILFVLLLLVFVAYSTAAVHKMQLHKREPMWMKKFKQGKEKYMEYMKERENLMLDSRFSRLNTNELSAGNTSLYDWADFQYTVHVTIGNPPQMFRVILDTISADFWVLDKTAKCAMNCDTTKKYHSELSHTYKKNGRKFRFRCGFSDFCNGFLGVDTVAIGGTEENQLIIPNTFVDQVTYLDGIISTDIEGSLGLGTTEFNSRKVDPPLVNAFKQKLLDAPIFTIWMETEGPTADKTVGGMLTYGGIDTDHCGPVIDYVPLTSPSEYSYQFQIQGVNVGTKMKVDLKHEVVIHSGSSFMVGPKRAVMAIAKAVGGRFDRDRGLFVMDCNAKYDPITFTINNKKYDLGPEVMTINLGPDYSGKVLCVLAIIPYDLHDTNIKWIFSPPFLRKYCTIFDLGQKRLGFALNTEPCSSV